MGIKLWKMKVLCKKILKIIFKILKKYKMFKFQLNEVIIH